MQPSTDRRDANGDIVAVGQRFTPLEAFLYDLSVGNYTSAILGAGSAITTFVTNPSSFVNNYVRPRDLVTTSRVLTRGIDAASSYYNRFRDRIDATAPRSSPMYVAVQQSLAPVDFAAAFVTRGASSLAAIPGVIGDPVGATRGFLGGVARSIDAVALDSRPIYRVASDTYGVIANSSLRQISTAAGTIAADVALSVGPKFGATRFIPEAEASAAAGGLRGLRTRPIVDQVFAAERQKPRSDAASVDR